jgi:tryptophan-rich sensory protein
MEVIILYFVINAILAAIVWWAFRPKDISKVGYTLFMLLLGLPILLIIFVFAILLLVAASIGILGTASYNFGDAMSKGVTKLFVKRR